MTECELTFRASLTFCESTTRMNAAPPSSRQWPSSVVLGAFVCGLLAGHGGVGGGGSPPRQEVASAGGGRLLAQPPPPQQQQQLQRQQQPIVANRSWYFDLGVNDGGSVSQFLAARPERKWDVVMVEANPLLTDRLSALCATIVDTGAAASCLPLLATALATFDGPEGALEIFAVEHAGEATHGASTVEKDANVRTGKGRFGNMGGQLLKTRALDVLTLFREVAPVRAQDHVVVKLDIEGSEYAVLSRALFHGVLALWDEFYVEWHDGNPFIFSAAASEAEKGRRRVCLQEINTENGLRDQEWT